MQGTLQQENGVQALAQGYPLGNPVQPAALVLSPTEARLATGLFLRGI